MRLICLGIAFLALASGLAHANTCSDGKADSRFLPDRIGRPESGVPEAYLLKCDTMEVAMGDTTRIYSSQKVHFGPASSEKKIILVRGTLIVEGTSSFPTLFSGSLTEFAFGLKPGKAAWGGFRVAESGALIMKHAMINNATFAIDSRSQRVTLNNVHTKGCANLVKPDNEFIKLDIAGTTITHMDFLPEPVLVAQPLPVDSPNDSAEKSSKKPGYRKLLIWGGIGIAVLGGGTAVVLSAGKNEGKPNPPVTNDQLFPGDLAFPPTGGPRKP